MENNLKILSDIELEYAEQDTRGQYRAKLNWKTLFREVSKESYNKKIEEINSFFEDANIVIEKETMLPYKILEDKYLDIYLDFTLNKIFTGREEYFVSSKYLESPIWKAKYTSKSYELTKDEFDKISLSDNEKLKIQFLGNLINIDNFNFTQNGYFKEIVNAYKILLDKLEPTKISVTSGWNMIVEDGTHRIISLVELIKDWKNLSKYSLDILKGKIKIFIKNTPIIESKMLNWDFKFDDLEVLNYSEIDEKPSDDRVNKIIEGYGKLV